MRFRRYGQSAFLIDGGHTVFIDPFGSLDGLEVPEADLLLVTHEHADHNGVEAAGG